MEKVSGNRQDDLFKWVQSVFPCDQDGMAPLPGDASFRRYFRVSSKGETRIAVDAPLNTERSDAFVGIAGALSAQGIQVPTIYAADLKQGFLLISDLGEGLYSAHLNSSNVDQLYSQAIDSLVKIQQTSREAYSFPQYDRALLLSECELFTEWYLGAHLKINLSPREQAMLSSTFERLIENALEQPTTVVHRDYHSRNLLQMSDGQVGVLDFQDAVIGPVTYDLVSLLKDCYVSWPNLNVTNWVQRYFEKARDAGIIQDVSMGQFIRWFDLMGVQRHLKCMGIFSRLYLRDGKSQFLADIPRLIDYILSASSRYPQLNGIAKLLQGKVQKHESNDSSSGSRKQAASINE